MASIARDLPPVAHWTWEQFAAAASLPRVHLDPPPAGNEPGRVLVYSPGPWPLADSLRKSWSGEVIAASPLFAADPANLARRLNAALARHMGPCDADHLCDPRARRVYSACLAAVNQAVIDLTRTADRGNNVSARLPRLPFPDGHFDLAISTHPVHDGAAKAEFRRVARRFAVVNAFRATFTRVALAA